MILQPAADADREAVNALAKQVHAVHVGWRPDIFEMVEELYSGERFQTVVKEQQLYVAKVDGIPVGYALLRVRGCEWPGLIKRKVMLVDELCVAEAYRRQGIGMKIMEDIQSLAKSFGCDGLQLGAYPENESALAFYRKCGFTVRSVEMQKKV